MQPTLTEGDGIPFAGFGQDPSPKSPKDPKTTTAQQTSIQTGNGGFCGTDKLNKVTLQEPGSPLIGALGAMYAATSAAFGSYQPQSGVDCLDPSRPFFNYDICTCGVQLPPNYAQGGTGARTENKKSTKKLAKAAIWCGLDECGVKEILPPDDSGVVCKPIASWKSVPIRPGMCCYKNDQVIFQMPEKTDKINESAYYKVDSGTGEPHLVQMANMDDEPEKDLGNDTFLMTISKLDDSGQERRLQLAIKSPRDLDETPCITTATTQYATEDVPPGWQASDGGKKKKGGEKAKGKGNKGKKKK